MFQVSINKMEGLQKENIQADQGRPQSTRINKSKQFALKIENAQRNKWKTKDKAPSFKADLSTAILQSWNQLDEDYCFSLFLGMFHYCVSFIHVELLNKNCFVWYLWFFYLLWSKEIGKTTSKCDDSIIFAILYIALVNSKMCIVSFY